MVSTKAAALLFQYQRWHQQLPEQEQQQYTRKTQTLGLLQQRFPLHIHSHTSFHRRQPGAPNIRHNSSFTRFYGIHLWLHFFLYPLPLPSCLRPSSPAVSVCIRIGILVAFVLTLWRFPDVFPRFALDLQLLKIKIAVEITKIAKTTMEYYYFSLMSVHRLIVFVSLW